MGSRARSRKREIEVLLSRPTRRRKGNEEVSDHPSRIRCSCGAHRKPKATELHGTVLWCEIDVFGQRYQVWVDREFHPSKPEGLCTWTHNRIDILEQSIDRMHDTLVHEIIHAQNDASGMKWTIAQLFPKLTVKQRRQLDELLCRFGAPAMLSIFRSLGWLHLPTWPPAPERKTARLRGNRRHPRPH